MTPRHMQTQMAMELFLRMIQVFHILKRMNYQISPGLYILEYILSICGNRQAILFYRITVFYRMRKKIINSYKNTCDGVHLSLKLQVDLQLY